MVQSSSRTPYQRARHEIKSRTKQTPIRSNAAQTMKLIKGLSRLRPITVVATNKKKNFVLLYWFQLTGEFQTVECDCVLLSNCIIME